MTKEMTKDEWLAKWGPFLYDDIFPRKSYTMEDIGKIEKKIEAVTFKTRYGPMEINPGAIPGYIPLYIGTPKKIDYLAITKDIVNQ